jgi:hypothetical protein
MENSELEVWMAVPEDGSESLNEMLDPHRREEREAAAIELTGRLAQKGVDIDSGEDPAQLADLLSAVEQFESAVTAAGGDLMVNSPESSDPQDSRFVLPARRADEAIGSYLSRILEAAREIEGRAGQAND